MRITERVGQFLGRFLATGPALSAVQRLRMALFRDSRCIVISAMPKSGSTFLSNALAGVTGYAHGYAACDYFNIEQELYLPRLIDNYGRGIVVQQHFKANTANLRLLQAFGLRPVVLVRNVFDVIVSVRDHLAQESIGNIPALYPSSHFCAFDQADQFDYLIDFAAPWYLSYYVSWSKAAEDGAIDLLRLVYDEAVCDWVGTIRRVLDFHRIDCPDERIEQVVRGMHGRPRMETRMNVGVPGRGRALLSPGQCARVASLARFYPGVDFTPIGIGGVSSHDVG